MFFNPTYEDNYPTTNLEARACGTPVVTYNTGGSPESAGENGIVVEKRNLTLACDRIINFIDLSSVATKDLLDKEKMFLAYLFLYTHIVEKNLF